MKAIRWHQGPLTRIGGCGPASERLRTARCLQPSRGAIRRSAGDVEGAEHPATRGERRDDLPTPSQARSQSLTGLRQPEGGAARGACAGSSAAAPRSRSEGAKVIGPMIAPPPPIHPHLRWQRTVPSAPLTRMSLDLSPTCSQRPDRERDPKAASPQNGGPGGHHRSAGDARNLRDSLSRIVASSWSKPSPLQPGVCLGARPAPRCCQRTPPTSPCSPS